MARTACNAWVVRLSESRAFTFGKVAAAVGLPGAEARTFARCGRSPATQNIARQHGGVRRGNQDRCEYAE